MARRKSFGEKLTKELIRLAVTVVFLIVVGWFCFFVLPDLLTGMFMDNLDLP